MEDGQIAEITSWYQTTKYNGIIVQRHANVIICIGMPNEKSWVNIAQNTECRVRILEEGETLTIKNNQ